VPIRAAADDEDVLFDHCKAWVDNPLEGTTLFCAALVVMRCLTASFSRSQGHPSATPEAESLGSFRVLGDD
jgi:hypothetical protein